MGSPRLKMFLPGGWGWRLGQSKFLAGLSRGLPSLLGMRGGPASPAAFPGHSSQLPQRLLLLLPLLRHCQGLLFVFPNGKVSFTFLLTLTIWPKAGTN